MVEKEEKKRTAFFDAVLGAVLFFFGLFIAFFSPEFARASMGSEAISSTVFFGMLILGGVMALVGIALIFISFGKGLTRSL